MLTHINNSRSYSIWKAIPRAMAVLMLVVTILLPQATVCRSAPSEFDIKAACIYNFAKFVEWPSKVFQNDSSPLVIGVIGTGRVYDVLESTVSGKTANGRKISVKHFKSSREVKDCQVLVVCSSEERRMDSILSTVSGQPVLTVGEIDHFANNGGIINFYLDNSNVRFEINTNNANHAGLKISSQLLKLAKIINK